MLEATAILKWREKQFNMRIKIIPVCFIGGALIFNVVVEGKLYPYKSPEPHVPHVEYFSHSTSNLTHTISIATTSGSRIFVSGDRLI